MKKLIIMVALVWGISQLTNYFSKYKQEHISTKLPEPNNSQFRCDGRTHCSQMTSCEEAIFFIRNCPNTKMDGNGDGIPCEKQWCK